VTPRVTCVQVSTTRLAVRNIPVSWDEKRLKAAFIDGVKQRATKENPKVLQVSGACHGEGGRAGGRGEKAGLRGGKGGEGWAGLGCAP